MHCPARRAMDLPGVPPSLAFELRGAAQDAGVTRLALVGGVVRDLLLGMHPKDFDLVEKKAPQTVYSTAFLTSLMPHSGLVRACVNTEQCE